MTFRLIATDLDGTLLKDDGTVSPRTRAALARAAALGIAIVLVTGRPPRWVRDMPALTGAHAEVHVRQVERDLHVPESTPAVSDRGVERDDVHRRSVQVREVQPRVLVV